MAQPTLTPDVSGSPRVEVFLSSSDVVAGTETVRFWRFSEGREWLVRGGVDIAPGTAAIDWEVPFQTVAQYRAEMFNAAGGSLGFTDVAQTTLNVNDVWVHNPLVPTNAVRLGSFGLLDRSPVVSRPLVGDVVYAEGDVEGRWVGAGRRGVSGWSGGFAVDSVQDADALQRMLGDYVTRQIGVLCIRTPPPVRIPRTFFAALTEVAESDRDVRWGGRRTDFLFTATEARPPFPGITTPLLSYDDLDAAFASYGARDSAFASYTAMDRAYNYAGIAG